MKKKIGAVLVVASMSALYGFSSQVIGHIAAGCVGLVLVAGMVLLGMVE